MNISEYKKHLPILMKNNVVPFVWGDAGIGKSEIHEQFAAELGIRCFVLNLATQDVGDLVGLLVHDHETGTVYHAKPKWWPEEGTRGILFLDEANRAHPETTQAMYPLMTARKLHTHVLPEGWAIVLAGNYDNGSYTVNSNSDTAWISRFCQLDLRPTVQEFLAYTESKGTPGHLMVADFIQEQPRMLEVVSPNPPDFFVKPDRRSWEKMIARLENETIEEGVRHELYVGIVGLEATVAYSAHKKSAQKAVKLKDIVNDYSKVRRRVLEANTRGSTRLDILSGPIDELFHTLEKKPNYLSAASVTELQKFFLDIPLELLSKTATKLGSMTFAHKDDLLNNPTFVERCFNRAKTDAA